VCAAGERGGDAQFQLKVSSSRSLVEEAGDAGMWTPSSSPSRKIRKITEERHAFRAHLNWKQRRQRIRHEFWKKKKDYHVMTA